MALGEIDDLLSLLRVQMCCLLSDIVSKSRGEGVSERYMHCTTLQPDYTYVTVSDHDYKPQPVLKLAFTQNHSSINFKCSSIFTIFLDNSYVITFDISLTNIDIGGREITFSWQFRLKCCPLENITYFQKHFLCYFYKSKLKPKLNFYGFYPNFVLCIPFFWLFL